MYGTMQTAKTKINYTASVRLGVVIFYQNNSDGE